MFYFKYLALVLLFFLPSLSISQNYGAIGGLVISNIRGQGNSSIKPGLQAGGYAKFGTDEVIHFKAEILYTQKGSWNWSNVDVKNINLHYIDFTVMFGIDIFKNLSLNLGFQPSVRLGGTYKYQENNEVVKRNISNEISRLDYSTLIGAEYALDKTKFLGLRYNHSFIPLQEYDNIFNSNRVLPRSYLFQIYLGYRLY
jgi:hypothetical protein